jgi:hypothetical protein
MSAVSLLVVLMDSSITCNTTKATADSIVKFSSSTSPDSMFTGDGVVVKDQRVKLYTAVVADDLEENIARGQGEYLSSLGVWPDVPAEGQARFSTLSQENYASMFPAETNGSHDALTVLRQQLAVSQAQALR